MEADDDDAPASALRVVAWGCVGTLALALLFSAAESCERCTARGGVQVEDFWGVPRCVERVQR